MKTKRSNFQLDDELFPDAMADLEAMLASIEADQARVHQIVRSLGTRTF